MPLIVSRINVLLIFLYIIVVLPLWSDMLRVSPSPVFPPLIGRMIADQRNEVHDRAQVALLNALMPPSFADLAESALSKRDTETVDWGIYRAYFQHAASVLPAPLNSDAYALTGFCVYRQGQADGALSSYRRALELNPGYATTYYNLAVLYFKAGDYANAADLISRMMAMNREASLSVIATSKFYLDILRDRHGMDPFLELNKTYAEAMRVLVISQYRLGKFPELANAARFAVASGFEPAEVFQYYTALSAAGRDERIRVQASANDPLYSGQDLTVRLF